jgi:hypothetical protein
VYDTCCCTGEALVPAGSHVHCDASGFRLCELCPTRLNRSGPHRPHGGGRAHIACIMRYNRANAAPNTPTPRTKRPYSALKPTQKWQRRCKPRVAVTEVLSNVSCSPKFSSRTHARVPGLCRASYRRLRSLMLHRPASLLPSLARSHSLPAAPLAGDAGTISMPNAAEQSAVISTIHACAEQGSRAATWRCRSTPTSSIAARLLACRRSVHCRMCRVSLPSLTLHRCIASPSLHSARFAAVFSALCLVACTQRCWRNLPLACSLRCRHSNTHAGLSFALLK